MSIGFNATKITYFAHNKLRYHLTNHPRFCNFAFSVDGGSGIEDRESGTDNYSTIQLLNYFTDN